MVLAAGEGRRLRPLTDLRPKALCPVGGVPLVDLAIRLVRPHAVAVAVNVHAHRDQMERHLAVHQPAAHVSIEEPEALGTAGALGRLRDWIDERPVLLHNADAWHDAGLGPFVHDWDGERIRLLVVPAPPPGDFGGRWRYAGVALLPWWSVAPLRAEPTGLYEVSWREADERGLVELVPHRGRWFDTGTPATYLAANLAASGGRNVIGRGARVDPSAELVRTVVWDGAMVGPGECLVDAIRATDGVTVTVESESSTVS